MSVKIRAMGKPSAQYCQAKSSVMPCLHAEILSNSSFIKYFINCTLKSQFDSTLPMNSAQCEWSLCICVCVCTWKGFVRRQFFYKSAHVAQWYKTRKLWIKRSAVQNNHGVFAVIIVDRYYRSKINWLIPYLM